MTEAGLDLLVVGAHPDDAEVHVGGLLSLASKMGLKAAILDLTVGELGSRGASLRSPCGKRVTARCRPVTAGCRLDLTVMTMSQTAPTLTSLNQSTTRSFMKLSAIRILVSGVLACGALSAAWAQEATGAGASFPAPPPSRVR